MGWGWLLKLIGANPIGQIADGIVKWRQVEATAQTDEKRLEAQIQIKSLEAKQALHEQQADVIKTGMQFRIFWVAWSLATIPVCLWFAWGVADSIANGALPDTAALPPQLLAFAEIVWQNVFYTGVAGGAVELAGRVLRR